MEELKLPNKLSDFKKLDLEIPVEHLAHRIGVDYADKDPKLGPQFLQPETIEYINSLGARVAMEYGSIDKPDKDLEKYKNKLALFSIYYKSLYLLLTYVETNKHPRFSARRLYGPEDSRSKWVEIIDHHKDRKINLFIHGDLDKASTYLDKKLAPMNLKSSRKTPMIEYGTFKILIKELQDLLPKNFAKSKFKTLTLMAACKHGFLYKEYYSNLEMFNLSEVARILGYSSAHNILYYPELLKHYPDRAGVIIKEYNSYSKLSAEDKREFIKNKKTMGFIEAGCKSGFASISFGQRVLDECKEDVLKVLEDLSEALTDEAREEFSGRIDKLLYLANTK